MVGRVRWNYTIRVSFLGVQPMELHRLCSLKGHTLGLLLSCYRLETLNNFIFELVLCMCSLMGLGGMSRADTPGVSTHRCRLGYSGTVDSGQRPWPGRESTGSLLRDGTKPSGKRPACPSISKPTPIASVKINSPAWVHTETYALRSNRFCQ